MQMNNGRLPDNVLSTNISLLICQDNRMMHLGLLCIHMGTKTMEVRSRERAAWRTYCLCKPGCADQILSKNILLHLFSEIYFNILFNCNICQQEVAAILFFLSFENGSWRKFLTRQFCAPVYTVQSYKRYSENTKTKSYNISMSIMKSILGYTSEVASEESHSSVCVCVSPGLVQSRSSVCLGRVLCTLWCSWLPSAFMLPE